MDLITHDSSTGETRARITSVLVLRLRTSSLAGGTVPPEGSPHVSVHTCSERNSQKRFWAEPNVLSSSASFLSLEVLDKIAHKHLKVLLTLGSAAGASWEPEKTELFLLFSPLWSFLPVVVIRRLFWEFRPERIWLSGRWRPWTSSQSGRPSAGH